jgi:hypothetical protein
VIAKSSVVPVCLMSSRGDDGRGELRLEAIPEGERMPSRLGSATCLLSKSGRSTCACWAAARRAARQSGGESVLRGAESPVESVL